MKRLLPYQINIVLMGLYNDENMVGQQMTRKSIRRMHHVSEYISSSMFAK